MADKVKDDTITYKIVAPKQVRFNQSTGKYEDIPPYSSGKDTVFGLQVIHGKASTTDPKVAIEFLDMGYTVEPDPRPVLQEEWTKRLERDAKESEDAALALRTWKRDLERYQQRHGATA